MRTWDNWQQEWRVQRAPSQPAAAGGQPARCSAASNDRGRRVQPGSAHPLWRRPLHAALSTKRIHGPRNAVGPRRLAVPQPTSGGAEVGAQGAGVGRADQVLLNDGHLAGRCA